jgi:hypothetical protein
MLAGVAEMSGAKKRSKPAPPPAAGPARETIINMKVSRAYSEWLEAIHRKTHIPKSSCSGRRSRNGPSETGMTRRRSSEVLPVALPAAALSSA